MWFLLAENLERQPFPSTKKKEILLLSQIIIQGKPPFVKISTGISLRNREISYSRIAMMTLDDELRSRALTELTFEFAPLIVLSTAVTLGILDSLAAQALRADQVSSATGCSLRGVRMILDCLAATGSLEKERGRYALRPLARKYFVSSSEEYAGEMITGSRQILTHWLSLPESVRTGRPALFFSTDEERGKFNASMASALFQAHKGCAWEVAEQMTGAATSRGQQTPIRKILDVAAGSGVWSIPFAQRDRKVEVTAIDLSPVLQVTGRYTRQCGVNDQYRLIGGNIRDLAFGREEYDLAILGHICHSEGAKWSQELIGKAFHSLREDARLLIMDFLPDEERRLELLPLLLALNALLGTEEGDTFTFSQYEQWLLNAGFGEVETLEVTGHSPIIVAAKR